jgi:hypothetical protein
MPPGFTFLDLYCIYFRLLYISDRTCPYMSFFPETLIFRYKHGDSIIFNVVLIHSYQGLDLGRLTFTFYWCHARVHNWKSRLCRVPSRLPSAKYRGTRQSHFLPSAALDKLRHSAKANLPSATCFAKCRGPRQSRPSAKVVVAWWRPPAVNLCQVPAVRHLKNIFLKKNSLPSALEPALGKDHLCWVPAVALGKIILFYFVFVAQFFCGALVQYLKGHVQIWGIFDFFIYLVNFFFVSLNFSNVSNLNCRCME